MSKTKSAFPPSPTIPSLEAELLRLLAKRLPKAQADAAALPNGVFKDLVRKQVEGLEILNQTVKATRRKKP